MLPHLLNSVNLALVLAFLAAHIRNLQGRLCVSGFSKFFLKIKNQPIKRKYSMIGNSPLFFMHIPKTAGTSITALIEDNLSLSEIFQMTEIRDAYYGNTLDYRSLKNARAVCGHIPLSVSRLMAQPVRTLVFLRSPVDLSISIFNHFRRIGEIEKNFSLADFLNSPYAEAILNSQTKWLSGDQINNVPTARPARNFEFGAGAPIEDLIKSVGESSLQKAKNNLKQFSFVGIFEKMPESVSPLQEKFGFNRSTSTFRLNVGDYDKVIDIELMRLLAEKNSLDQQLYEFGLDLFHRQTAIPLTETLTRHTPRSSWVELDMNNPMRHEGFHRREFWPHWNGVRWTTDVATISLPCVLDPSIEYSYELTAIAAISGADVQTTDLAIGGMKLDYHLQSGTGIHMFRGTIVPTSTMLHPELKIEAPYARRPSESMDSSDTRLLGLAVKSFRLKPVRCCAVDFSD